MTELVRAVFERLVPDGKVPSAYIDGGEIATTGEIVAVEDPATRNTIAEFAQATPDVVDAAVQSAKESFRAWREVSPARRGQLLAAAAAMIRMSAEDLAILETLDTGKPLRQARADVETAARYFEFYAGAADKVYGDSIPNNGDYWAYTLREPFGVVAHITPWNSPISQMCRGVAPSLAVGNTAVVKPSEVTPLSTIAVARLLVAAGIPAGVCNVVNGAGRHVGEQLLNNDDVQHYSFTGSVETGRRVAAIAAERLVACNLELGGKSPTIVMPDADLDAAVTAGAMAVVRNAGQSCFATTRLVVHRSIAEEYGERLSRAVSGITVGPGIEDHDIGPLVSVEQLAKVLAAIERGTKEGARLAVGGIQPGGLDGYFLMPGVFTNVENAMSIAQEEIFGPVQTVLPFDDLDEAIAIANDSAYGLAAGIFTADITTAHSVARQLEAGQVQVNGYPLGGIDTPFGGYKASGIGREKGLAALEHFTQLKTVIVKS